MGEVVSPAIVYKERQGIPITAPGVAVRKTYYYTVGEVAAKQKQVPYSRIEVLSPYVEAHWRPVYGTTNSENLAEIARVGQTIVGWKITLKERSEYCECHNARFELTEKGSVHAKCGRGRAALTDEQFVEHVQSLSFGVTDDFYNTFYMTIKGNDSIDTPAGPAKGGTRITGGRAEYNQKTKGMVHWDDGFMRERGLAEAREKKDRQESVTRHAEVFTKKFFPRRERR